MISASFLLRSVLEPQLDRILPPHRGLQPRLKPLADIFRSSTERFWETQPSSLNIFCPTSCFSFFQTQVLSHYTLYTECQRNFAPTAHCQDILGKDKNWAGSKMSNPRLWWPSEMTSVWSQLLLLPKLPGQGSPSPFLRASHPDRPGEMIYLYVICLYDCII